MKKHLSQNEWTLRYLQSHVAITPLQANEKYGIQRLSARISDLRGMGYPILSNIVEKKNRFGETCRVAEYRLVGR